MAVAEASFSTSMLVMSLGFRLDITLVLSEVCPDMAIPSITYSGSLPFSELIPRICTEIPPPGAPEFWVTATPAIRPCMACSTEVFTPCLMAFSSMDDTEPVRSERFITP